MESSIRCFSLLCSACVKFMQNFVWSCRSFSLPYNITLCESTIIYVFVLLWTSICFQKFLGLGYYKYAAINILVYVFCWKTIYISIGCISRSGIFTLQRIHMFGLLVDYCQTVFHYGSNNYTSISNVWECSVALCHHQYLVFILDILVGGAVVSQSVLIFVLLQWLGWTLFNKCIGHFVSLYLLPYSIYPYHFLLSCPIIC